MQMELLRTKQAADREKREAAEKARQEKEEAAEEKKKQQELTKAQKDFFDCKGKDGKKDVETIQRKKQMLKEVRVSAGHPT